MTRWDAVGAGVFVCKIRSVLLFAGSNHTKSLKLCGVQQEQLESHRGFSFNSRGSEAVDVDRVQELYLDSG